MRVSGHALAPPLATDVRLVEFCLLERGMSGVLCLLSEMYRLACPWGQLDELGFKPPLWASHQHDCQNGWWLAPGLAADYSLTWNARMPSTAACRTTHDRFLDKTHSTGS